MSAASLASLVGLAFLDSLNPFSIAAQAYLLGTLAPHKRSLAFVAGTFAVYLLAGVLLLSGASAALGSAAARVPSVLLTFGQVAFGLGCVGVAIYLWLGRGKAPAMKPPSNLGIGATLVFALVSTASDVPTALPYFAALAQITGHSLTWSQQAVLLLLYNAVYVVPLVALVLAHAALGARSQAVFGLIQRAVNWSFAKLMPVLLAALGGWVLLDAWLDFGS